MRVPVPVPVPVQVPVPVPVPVPASVSYMYILGRSYGYVMMSVEGPTRLSFEFRPLQGGVAGGPGGVAASDVYAIEK